MPNLKSKNRSFSTMPIIWRYLLSQFFKVLLLSLTAFIAVLLTTRLDEIAHFATLGSQGLYILLFTLYQIPYILPIAIPISCLISIVILIQRLSTSHELTALRACGLSIRNIFIPILFSAALIGVGNFYIASELATHSHLQTGLLKNELRSINPLLLLHNKHLMRLKGIFFDTMGASQMGETASEVIIAMPNRKNSRINVMLAENLQATPQSFSGKGMTLITSLHSNDRERFDQLAIENIGKSTTSIQDFSQTLQKKVWSINNDHLRLSLLRVRINDALEHLQEAKKNGAPISEVKQIQRSINRGYSELVRRISLGIAAFTFTLMGAAFGISISRTRSNRGLFFVVGLASLYIVAYFAAKGIDHLLLSSSLVYLVPHLIIILSSIWVLNRISKGIE